MNKGKYVFARLAEFLPQRILDNLVLKYLGNKCIRHFTCWNQMLCFVFGQLSNRDSMCDLIAVIEAHNKKSYHLGFGRSVTRGNFSKANINRNSKLFEGYAYYLKEIARRKCSNENFEIKGKVYAFDSKTIDLCLSVFWWAKFRKAKGGIKLFTLYDISTQIPAFIHITSSKVNDMNAMDMIPFEREAYYVFDRGYVEYTRLYKITRQSAFFVVRARSNLQFARMYSQKVDKTTGVILDQVGKLSGFYTSQQYSEKLRKVKYYYQESNRVFVFLTNYFELTAQQVALLYKIVGKLSCFSSG
jgi:hypothetical protein